MTRLHPPVAPDEEGMLDVGDGQLLHWERRGAPDGAHAVVLHGGPGSGCAPWMAQLLDPAVFRVVLVDQRGAGRSTPHASDPACDLAVVTTAHLVADLERLREHLGVARWLVLGMSWGSTLGLAYAQAHPGRVSALVLAPVTLTRPSDVAWLSRGLRRFLPAEWEAFRAGVPAAERDGDLVAAYARLLASPDAAVRERAARDWCAWEQAVVAPEGDGTPDARYADPRFRLAFARLVTHVFAHAAWLGEDALLRGAARLAGIPGCSSTGGSTWAARCTAPGTWRARGRAASSSWWRGRGTSRAGSRGTSWRRRTGSRGSCGAEPYSPAAWRPAALAFAVSPTRPPPGAPRRWPSPSSTGTRPGRSR